MSSFHRFLRVLGATAVPASRERWRSEWTPDAWDLFRRGQAGTRPIVSIAHIWQNWRDNARRAVVHDAHLRAVARHYLAADAKERAAWDTWMALCWRHRIAHPLQEAFETLAPEVDPAALRLSRGWLSAEARTYRQLFLEGFIDWSDRLPSVIAECRAESLIRTLRLAMTESVTSVRRRSRL